MRSSATSPKNPRDGGEHPTARRRMPLLALGWVLVAVLPVIAAVLVVTEYDDYQAASEQRSRLIADAVQRQLLDRLYLVGRQLEDAAGRQADPVVPMAAVVQ